MLGTIIVDPSEKVTKTGTAEAPKKAPKVDANGPPGGSGGRLGGGHAAVPHCEGELLTR